MPFKRYNDQRLRHIADTLRSSRYKNRLSIQDFAAMEETGDRRLAPPSPAEMPGEMHLHDMWRGYDRYLWLSCSVTVPRDYTPGSAAGLFHFGDTGGGNTSGFEALCFVNGQAYQGVDINHQEILLPEAAPGETLQFHFRLWSGLNGGGFPQERIHFIDQAELAELDEPTDQLYHWLRLLLGAYDILPSDDPAREKLLGAAVEAWDLVDETVPGSPEFYQSVPGAVALLQERFPEGRTDPVTVKMIGHTHIDLAWLWRICHTHEKCRRSFHTVDTLMKRFPDYRFLQTQAQAYDWIKQEDPELFERIRALVKEGRWEAAGGMWVECDCNLPSGESIVRQILYGTRFFEREFGSHSRYLWLPDVFGYSWALPQILKKAEMDTFITTKISWNDQNKMPYDTFVWKGMDGSEVLAHFITTPCFAHDKGTLYTYNGEAEPYAVRGLWENYANKDLNTDLLMCYGYGDGGGGVTRDMLSAIPILARIPGLPEVAGGRVDDFCEKLHRNVEENRFHGYVPTWDGELYLEHHRGTLTSHGSVKEHNRRLEFLFRDTEMAQAAQMLRGIAPDRERVHKAWETVLLNQFHDIIPGSSIHETYQDVEETYAAAQASLEGLCADLLGRPEGETFFVNNTYPWPRQALIRLEGDYQGREFLSQGKKLPAFLTSTGAEVVVPLPPCGSVEVTVQQGASPLCGFVPARVREVETDFYRITWNEAGHLTSLLDKKHRRQLLTPGREGNVLTLYEDKPRCADAWELEPTINEKARPLTDLKECSLRETPLGVDVHFVWTFSRSTFTQVMRLYHHTPRIDFETQVDWQDREVLLKAVFPLDIRSTRARYDIQFGNVERPTTANNPWEFAKFEVVGHKWADWGETDYGAALLSGSKYGFDIREGVMRLTLLKASNYPDWDQDRGLHAFTYSLYPHAGEWHQARVEEESLEINARPFLSAQGLACPVGLLGEGIALDALKPAEDENALILRVHEFRGRRAQGRLNPRFPFKALRECNLLERQDGPGLDRGAEGEIGFELKPYEIKTFKFEL